jgi:glycine betaine catabolism B
MKKYVCSVCGYEYDPQMGLPECGFAPGTPFAELPDDFECPLCGVGKNSFGAVEPAASEVPGTTAAVSAVISRTPTVKSVRLALQKAFFFTAGQYLQVALMGNPQLRRCLSISNSPTERGYLEVTKRITDSSFSQALCGLKEGDQVQITGPFGAFTIDEGRPPPAFLSGGIGITPLRSMCRYLTDIRPDCAANLIYANRSEDEIAFRRDFDEIQKCSGLRVVHTLTRAADGWNGRRGRIDSELIKTEIPDYLQRTFYVCGPPQMVSSLRGMLLEQLEVPASNIKTEEFSGY